MKQAFRGFLTWLEVLSIPAPPFQAEHIEAGILLSKAQCYGLPYLETSWCPSSDRMYSSGVLIH
jgi:hypothetical protein